MKTTLCIIAITLALCFSARADAGQRTQDLARHYHSHYHSHYYSGRHYWHNHWYGPGYYGPSFFVGSPYYYYGGGPGFSVVASGPVGYPPYPYYYPVGGYWSSGRYYYHGHRWHR